MSTSPSTPKTGQELLAEIVNDSETITLDHVLARSPFATPLSDDELLVQMKALRAERARIDVKQEKARDKKRGQEEVESDESDGS